LGAELSKNYGTRSGGIHQGLSLFEIVVNVKILMVLDVSEVITKATMMLIIKK
jgi:hypothetical protein